MNNGRKERIRCTGTVQITTAISHPPACTSSKWWPASLSNCARWHSFAKFVAQPLQSRSGRQNDGGQKNAGHLLFRVAASFSRMMFKCNFCVFHFSVWPDADQLNAAISSLRAESALSNFALWITLESLL